MVQISPRPCQPFQSLSAESFDIKLKISLVIVKNTRGVFHNFCCYKNNTYTYILNYFKNSLQKIFLIEVVSEYIELITIFSCTTWILLPKIFTQICIKIERKPYWNSSRVSMIENFKGKNKITWNVVLEGCRNESSCSFAI